MKKRPRTITIICWILFITSGISLIMTTVGMNSSAVQQYMTKSSIPVGVQFILIYAGLLITIVSSFAMLKGKGWGRLLYVAWSVIAFSASLATSPTAGVLPGIILFLIIVFFLFRREANEFFKAGKKE